MHDGCSLAVGCGRSSLRSIRETDQSLDGGVVMKEQVLAFVIDAARNLVAEQGIELTEELNENTRLFGQNGLLDTLALVSLVITVEEGIEQKFGVRVEIADDKALSQKHSPYRTIGTLAAYAAQELEARRAAG
jgi:hypothetical protein